MRSFLSASALLAFASLVATAPAPAPQDIDFDFVDSLPVPTYSIDATATAQQVSYNPTSVISGAFAQITITDVADASALTKATSDVSVTTADSADSSTPIVVVDDTSTPTEIFLAKRTACQPQPTGARNAPAVANDVLSFQTSTAFAAIAQAALAPAGWTRTFVNANASNKYVVQ